MRNDTAAIDITGLLAEEALFLGASFAHIAAYREHQRMARIARSNREALRMHERRTGGRAFR